MRTRRTRLVPFAEAQLDALSRIFRQADVRRYLLDDVLVDEQWVRAEIAASSARFAAGSVGLWTVTEAESGEAIGFVGFRPFFAPAELQLLYGLLSEAWGRGLATEAGRAAIRWAFARGLEAVVAAADEANVASLRVMRRLGLGYRDRRVHDGKPTISWVLTRHDFERAPVDHELRVLVVCTHNSARSQMAEALLRNRWAGAVLAASAGTHPSAVHPLARAALEQVGISSAGLRSKRPEEAGEGFDVVVTVCDSARESCPYVPARLLSLHQSFADPAAAPGDEAQRLAEFGRVRDEIAEWLQEQVPRWIAARGDTHQSHRLPDSKVEPRSAVFE